MGLTRFHNGRRELLLIQIVGIVLGFQAESIVISVNSTIFAGCFSDKIAGIKLNTGQIGIGLHGQTCFVGNGCRTEKVRRLCD